MLQKMNGKKEEAAYRKKRKWLTAVTCMAAAVVFCTTYALILPAITLEKDQTLNCSYEIHQHDDSCYDGEGNLICGKQEVILHEHSADCYDENGNLTCGLLECREHQHDEACIGNAGSAAGTDGTADAKGSADGTGGTADGKGSAAGTGGTADTTGNTAGTGGTADTTGSAVGTVGTVNAKRNITGTDDGIATANIDGIPDDILQKLADEQKIYPGTKTVGTDGKEIWTAYDSGDASDAGVKAVVTLPQGAQAAEGHYLYIREVESGEPYYPTETALQETVGRYNDVQCYAIHWVHIYQDENGDWQYAVDTESVLGEDAVAEVNIEYQKDGAYLQGHQAERKLQVYNSRESNGSVLEDASTPTAVTANEGAYTGFTFTTNRGGPYVFVSKYLYKGYVRSIDITKMTDGTVPFDGNNDAGNDSGDANHIVRSYDSIQYNLIANFAARSNEATDTEAQMGFEMTLQSDVTEAFFDTSQMLWLKDGYTIEYLDKDGNVVLRQDETGKYYDKDNKETSLNNFVSDSTHGGESYTTKIVSQKLQGTITLPARENMLASNQNFSAAIQVLGAKNGSLIQPAFRAWFVGNEDNYGSESAGEGSGVQLAEKVTTNQKLADPVTVSAAARFNLELNKNSNVTYKGWFDSEKGKEIDETNTDRYTVGTTEVTGAQLYELLEELAELEENAGKSNPEEYTDSGNACAVYLSGQELGAYASIFQKIRYGRITGWGITLQIYNQALDGQNTASKGFKGVSLPVGQIGFDLDLESSVTVTAGNVDRDQYYAQLWEYNENVNESAGNQGRNMYWASLDSTKYAAWAAVYNSGTPGDDRNCYNGGTWKLAGGNGYHFTVSGYDFNFLSTGLKFPTIKAGDGSVTDGYNTYIGCFSAGYVQVLNVFPRNQTGTLNLHTDVTVKNLEVNTKDGQSISADPSDNTGYAHETNQGDNKRTDNIPLYAKGGMTKANAFCTAELFEQTNADFSGEKYFLGTDFWTTSYDCSAYAGQKITLVGAARIDAGDYQIRHMNMLQLFDSEALSVTAGKTPYVTSRVRGADLGEQRILYAADPHYPKGYDTNKADVMKYMNGVREEDLVYYTDLESLKDDGYVCVGVLAEVRNCCINGEGGYSTVLKIPMDISQDERFLGKTVATVNTVRMWTNREDMTKTDGSYVTWADGTYNSSTGKNSVEGYTDIKYSTDEHYCGEVANNKGSYEKTEYENGEVKLGTNTGGYVYGSSLLILGYKSNIDIEVYGSSVAQPSYDMDEGNNTVQYHLKEIIAKTDMIGTAQDTETNLTILTKMDMPRDKDTGSEQRIAVSEDSYFMIPASERMVLLDEKGERLEKQAVSPDPAHPTTVRYAFLKEGTDEIDLAKTYEIQVYAQTDTNGTQVTFELQGVTVGVSVPDLTFDALIDTEKVQNNNVINASAYISGTSDVRAYSTTAGNMDTKAIGIIKLASTRLVKSVDAKYIEQDGTFTYTVTYTNSGNDPVDVYLYDLLPDPDDIRDSDYEGEIYLGDITANLSGGDTFSADISFYYSKMKYLELYDAVRVFGNEGGGNLSSQNRVDNIMDMLNTGMTKDENGNDMEMFRSLGSINAENDHEFVVDESSFTGMTPAQRKDEMKAMTGIYAVVRNLGGGKTLKINLHMKSEGNQPGDLYRNIANSWLGDESEPLTSNRVETSTLSRTISGVVWEDADFDGERDEKENLISGVTCTLFKWNEENKKYEQCSEDVTGAEIKPVVTGKDGAYSFEKLAAGDYIVAFSGDGLKGNGQNDYIGATTYQVNGINDSNSNDAVALTDTESGMDEETGIAGIDKKTYRYAIAYSFQDEKVGAASLHTIPDIVDGNIPLINHVELHADLDCGLVIAGYELPETGGMGTTLFTIGGLLTMAGAVWGGYRLRRRREGRAGS